MVSTPEWFNDNSTRSLMTPPTLKKRSAIKSLCIFSNILYVKKKTSICWVEAAKSERKFIKAGTTPLALKPKRKVNSRIKYHIKKSLHTWIINHLDAANHFKIWYIAMNILRGYFLALPIQHNKNTKVEIDPYLLRAFYWNILVYSLRLK